MNTKQVDKTTKTSNTAVANDLTGEQKGFDTITQRQLQEAADNSPKVKQLKMLQAMANTSPQQKHLQTVQAMADQPADEWHVGQKSDKPIQQKADTKGPDTYFRPGVQAVSQPVQRVTLKVDNVDYNPQDNTNHHFTANQVKTTGVLNASYNLVKGGLGGYKNLVNASFKDMINDGAELAAVDIPTLAKDIYNDIETRYDTLNKNLGPLPQGHKNNIENAIKTKLNTFMKDQIFGHGLQSKADKADFDQMILVSTTTSQTKGTASEMTHAALTGVDGGADAAAVAADTGFKAVVGANAPPITAKQRKANYDVDVAKLPAAGRGVHHNVAGWLPALPRPATAPWKLAAPDHSRAAALAWIISDGAPSLYLEFNGGQTASRIVYDPINNITYATMHYTSIGGYNPFFKLT